MSQNGDSVASASSTEPSQRPKLNLKPRDAAAAAKIEDEVRRQSNMAKANPFGAAKPREAILAERTGKSEEEILREAAKAQRARLRLTPQQLEEKATLEAAVAEVKDQIDKETEEHKRIVLQTELDSRQKLVDDLLDSVEKLTLEAIAKGEVQRPSERRREQPPNSGRGFGSSEAGFGNGFAPRRDEGRGGGYREGGYRDGGYRDGGDRQGNRGGYREAGRGGFDASNENGFRRQYEDPARERGGFGGQREGGYKESTRSFGDDGFGEGFGAGGRHGAGGRGGDRDDRSGRSGRSNYGGRGVPGMGGPLPGMGGPLPGAERGGFDADYRGLSSTQDRY